MPGWARFWEQGTGKTMPTVQEQMEWVLRGDADAVLVFAPNGVHSNWIHQEWPTWMPSDFFSNCAFLEFQTERADTQWHQRRVTDVLRGTRIPFVAMSYDALMTKRGLEVAQHLLKRRKCFLTGDELHRIKDPSAKRTKRVLAASKWAVARRALTGTPVLESPFNAYTLMKFIDAAYWHPYRLTTYTTFRAMFGLFGKGWASPEQKRAMAARGQMDLSNQVGYQNLDLLQDALSSHSSRYLKADVLDLPPKTYRFRTHELSRQQEAVYEQLRENLIAELDGGSVTTKMVLTELLRLQQVASGHVKLDDGRMLFFDPNPRRKLLAEVVEDIPHRHIIFNRFTEDVNIGMEVCKARGLRAGRYDGRDDTQARNDVVERFQHLPREHPRALDVIVANTQALSEGRTLTQAQTVIYYSNGWSALQRQQSEDRPHRIGQDHNVLYIDLMCPGTPDEKIVKAYRKKQSISEKVLGDNPRDWI